VLEDVVCHDDVVSAVDLTDLDPAQRTGGPATSFPR